jgi:hypothetical protein
MFENRKRIHKEFKVKKQIKPRRPEEKISQLKGKREKKPRKRIEDFFDFLRTRAASQFTW